VSELGDLLELLYSAHRSFETVRGALLTRRDSELGERAFREFHERQQERGSSRSTLFALGQPDDEPPPNERVSKTSFWYQRPDRFREEITSDHPHGRDGWMAVRDGERWWSFSPETGGMSNENDLSVGSGIGHEIQPLFDPVDLLVNFELTIVGTSEVGSRRTIEVRAVERALLNPYIHGFPFWGDEVRCSVDAERGIIVRKVLLLGGAEFNSEELSELVFDEPISPETFSLELPAGETFVDLDARPEEVTLAEAAERASFRVFAVAKLPEGDWRMMIHFMPGRQRPQVPESVHINYVREDAQLDLSLSESPADAADLWPDRFDEDPVVREGISYRVHAGEGGAFGPPAMVRFDRDGTRIVITSQALEVDALIDLAAELVEASS